MAHFTRSRAVREAEISGEGDVEPDDVPLVVDSAKQSVRSSVTAARGPLFVTTELAGPESVPFGGGSGTYGSIGPLTVGTTLRGSGGHSDPAVMEISPVQSRVLSGSGGSSLGLVGVGIPAAAADAAAAATVGGVVERTGRAESFAERADSPTNRTHTIGQDLSHTEMPNLTTTKKPDLTVVLTVTEVFTLRSPTRRPRAHHKIVSHQSVIATFVFVVIKYFGEAVLRPLACCGQGQVPPVPPSLFTPLQCADCRVGGFEKLRLSYHRGPHAHPYI